MEKQETVSTNGKKKIKFFNILPLESVSNKAASTPKREDRKSVV